MKILGPSPVERLNKLMGFVYLAIAGYIALSLVSYYPQDPSWNVATGAVRANNLTGVIGSHIADLLLQCFGLVSFLLPLGLIALSWKWVQSAVINAPWAKIVGSFLLFVSVTALLCAGPHWTMFN